MNARRHERAAGFTLVELVVVIVLAGIIGTVVFRNIARPVRAFVDLQRRAELVDIAGTALARMTREIRLALPNSVRVSPDGRALEFLRTATGGRYRRARDATSAATLAATDELDFTLEADRFDVLGPLNPFSGIDADAGASTADCITGDTDCLVVFNTGLPADCSAPPNPNAWCGDNLAAVTAADTVNGQIEFARTAGTGPFPFTSERQRFHIVDTPVSFVCSGTTLARYDGYAISTVQPQPPAAVGRALAEQVGACSFVYDSGTSGRSGLVTIRLGISAINLDGQAETVTLLEQVHVRNVP